MSIEDIILGCKQQDYKSQQLLVQEYAPKLLAICRRYCQSIDMAHDALQECFLNVFKYIYTVKIDGCFDGWIKKIAVNSSIQVIRKYKNLTYAEDDQIERLVEAQVPDVSAHLHVQEILALLDKLPPSLSTVFNLNVVEGYKHEEISSILGITASTSRSHLTKARLRIIELMQQEGHIVPEKFIQKNFN